MTKKQVATIMLLGFVTYTGVYFFVYLWRAFRVEEPQGVQVVGLWHGDHMTRAILVSVIFLIGLVLILNLAVLRRQNGAGHLRLRADLHQWLVEQGREMNEDPSRLADRAVARYRDQLAGTANR